MASSLNGTGLTFSSGATLNSPPVTSIATGNGLSGGTITTTGTLSLDTNNVGGIGSVGWFWYTNTGTQLLPGATVSGSNLFTLTAIAAGVVSQSINPTTLNPFIPAGRTTAITTGVSGGNVTFSPQSGTWRVIAGCPKQIVGGSCCSPYSAASLFIRVS